MKYFNQAFCDKPSNTVDIRFTKACDNSCNFCIDKIGSDSLGATNVDAIIKGLEAINAKSVLVLGGEPFINPKKLYEFILKAKTIGVEEIFVTTSIPKSFITEVELINLIIPHLSGLNISINSAINYIENNRLFNSTSNHNRLEILNLLLSQYNHIRPSLTLSKFGINSKELLYKSLDALNEYGAKDVKLTELQSNDYLYISIEEILGIKLPPAYINCEYKFKYKNLNVNTKRVCFMAAPKQPTFIEMIKVLYKRFIWKPKSESGFKVVYEDGSVQNDWIHK